MYRRTLPNPGRIDREDEKRMLPCRYILQGYCHKGQVCKFLHPGMHARDPSIRVPDLPWSFSMVPQYSQRSMGINNQSLMEMRLNRSKARFGENDLRASPTVAGRLESSMSPRNRNRCEGLTKNKITMISPSSQVYSDYLSLTTQGDVLNDKFHENRETAAEVAEAEESKPTQNTVFNHIDWSEFLAPGISPPAPTPVPEQGPA